MGVEAAMKLQGKNVLLTGGSRGLGRALLEAFVNEGANLLFCSQDETQLAMTYEEVTAQMKSSQKLLAQTCDISDEQSVSRLINNFSQEFSSLDVLINNAAIQGPIGPFESVDWSAWRRTIEVDLLGTALVCRKAIPMMKTKGRGKIINLSGGGATAPRPRFSAYAASKSALVRLTETLAEELREFQIDVNAIAPGSLNTRLLEEVVNAGPSQAGADTHSKALKQESEGGDSMEEAARLCVFLASSESDGITGRLISARWDAWTRLAEHRDALAKSDVYTLRRIVPGDRGLDW